MASEFHGSNHSSSSHNLMASKSALAGSWGSSSSSSSFFLTTPFKSELDSSETDDNEDEFILELTRQMEDYMLQEDDDDTTSIQSVVEPKSFSQLVNVKNQNQNQNQYRVVENSKRGRRWKMNESTQHMKYSRGRRVTSPGSGMWAVFLNRPGSTTGYNGTGVFLPPAANHSSAVPQSRKIPGCSAAIVPTRVLEALEQYFNKLKSLSPSNNLLSTESTHQEQRRDTQQKSRWRSTSIDRVEKKLPQEWTY